MYSLPHTVLIPISIIQAVVILWNAFLCWFAYYKFFHTTRKSKSIISLEIRIICIVAIIAHVICSIGNCVAFAEFGFCPNLSDDCRRHSITFTIASIIKFSSELFNLCLVYYLMARRVTNLLKDSLFELSKFVVLYFKIFILIQSTISIICTTWGAIWIWETNRADQVSNNHPLYLNTFAAMLLLGDLFYTINFLILLRIFVRKIQSLADCLFANKIDSQNRLFALIVRTVVCCGIAITSTLCTSIGVAAVVLSESVWVLAIRYLFVSVDTAINTSCLMLQWPFTQHIYDQLCGKIKCCKCDAGVEDYNETGNETDSNVDNETEFEYGNSNGNTNGNGNSNIDFLHFNHNEKSEKRETFDPEKCHKLDKGEKSESRGK